MEKSRYTDRERYFRELAETSEAYYIDYLRAFRDIDGSTRILEIGCGEGGNLLPFARLGCRVAGLDLAQNKIVNARKFFAARNAEGEFHCADFLTDNPFEESEPFDIILIHDVIEHIEQEDKDGFFARLKMYLKPDGIIFFGFPAWQMPFGGHQQICRSKVCSSLPFMHLLPKGMYAGYLRLFGEESRRIDELLSIKRSKMTPKKFEELCRRHGYGIADRTFWFISPHYRAKFGLRPRRLCGWIGRIPYIRNFMTTSCFYIINLNQR